LRGLGTSLTSHFVPIADVTRKHFTELRDRSLLLAPSEGVKNWKLFDADWGIDSAREIREYFIPDFSNWKDHDSYQTAFQRLVKDLKAEAGES
jgi:hypothetical protein